MDSLIRYAEDSFIEKKDFPKFNVGDTITAYYEITEDSDGKSKNKDKSKERIQFFKGVVIQKRGKGASATFTLRKISGSIGVERIFPIHMPALKKIEVNKSGKVRQSRIFYFRKLTGKKAKIKERKIVATTDKTETAK